ncbi:MAG: hypothetical protein CL908_20850 [Deltaproteobacteria bacterium]|nr:hypothetical protein [Deltaproteobacteria bacterium]
MVFRISGRSGRRAASGGCTDGASAQAGPLSGENGLRALCLIACGLVGLSCATPTLEDQRTISSESRSGALRGAGTPRRVVVITVAGLESADFLDPWGHVAAEGESVRMPQLAGLAREGVIGVHARPPLPGSSYASHATLATGKRPSGHGVVADTALDQDGNRSLPYWDNRLMKGMALWDAAIGRGVLALGWPTTAGARIELVVPDALPDDPAAGWLDFIGPLTSPLLRRELESISQQTLSADKQRDPRTWPSATERDAAFIELACRVAASERDPALWLIRLTRTASLQQSAGYGSVEVDAALARVDHQIGRLIGCLDAAGQLADSAVFVLGDVAYRPVHSRVDPNVALVREGLIGRDPRSSTGVRSWLAVSRSSGRSAYVYARDADSALAAREILEAEALRTSAFEVVSAAELAETGADPQAWFGLAARPGYLLGNRLIGPLLSPAEVRGSAGGLASREIDGSVVGLVAWGRGIRTRVRIQSLDLVDIAPTIATLLGLRLDDPIDGDPLVGILRAAVPPPPPGPKRLGVGRGEDVERTLRELGGGRELGRDR